MRNVGGREPKFLILLTVTMSGTLALLTNTVIQRVFLTQMEVLMESVARKVATHAAVFTIVVEFLINARVQKGLGSDLRSYVHRSSWEALLGR
jgi:hypothetical protein